MKQIFALTIYNSKKLIREKIVYIVFAIGLIFIALSLLLGSLSFDEQIRILFHLGSTAVQLVCLGIAIFMGANLIPSDIKDQTILLLLSRPLSRGQYFIGQLLGLLGIILTVWFLLAGILYIVSNQSLPLSSFLLSQLGTYFETMTIACFVMMISLVVRPYIAIFSGIGLFLIGNWLEELSYFAKKSNDQTFILFAKIVQYLTPQLYRSNWRSYYLVQNNMIGDAFFPATLHLFSWCLFFAILGMILLRRKDLV